MATLKKTILALCASICAAMTTFGADGTLPPSFVRLDYIESNGKQCIDPNFMPTATTTFEARFRPLTSSGNHSIFGTGWSNDRFLLNIQSWRFKFHGNGTDLMNINFTIGSDYVVSRTVDGTITTVDETANKTYIANGGTAAVGGSRFTIFTAGGDLTSNGGRPATTRLYSLKFADGENAETLRDLVPSAGIVDGEVKVGLYDFVTETFYPNIGTAPFTYPIPTTSALGMISITSDTNVGTLSVYTNSTTDALSGYNLYALHTGTQLQALMKETSVDDGKGTTYVLKGWELTVTDASGTVTTTKSDESNIQNCYYTPNAGESATLRYMWETQCTTTFTYNTDLITITPAPQASYPAGTTITLTASATDPTKPFATWTGDAAFLSAIDPTSPTITFTIDAPVSIGAFATVKTAYVAHDTAAATPDGTSWASAFPTIQAALDSLSGVDGAVAVRVKSGDYLLETATTIPGGTANDHIAIIGGFSGTDLDKSGETVVARPSTVESCIPFYFNCASSISVAFESLTISNGVSNVSSERFGFGISLLNNKSASIIDCTFVRNGIDNTTSRDSTNDSAVFGAALGAQGGTLFVKDSTFTKNAQVVSNGGGNHHGYGSAIGMLNGYATIRDSEFHENYSQTVHGRDAYGGAIGLRKLNKVLIEGCTFTTNFIRRASGNNTSHQNEFDSGGLGGSIALNSVPDATIRNCKIIGGWSNAACTDKSAYMHWGFGGVIFLNSSTTTIEKTIIQGSGETGYADGSGPNCANGSIDNRYGTLILRNVLHANAHAGWAVGNSEGTVIAENCTFAGAKGLYGTTGRHAFYKAVGYAQYGARARATFNNCIFANNANGDYAVDADTTLPTLNYCYTQGKHTGPGLGNRDGVTTADFADTTYYHPVSRAGSYKGGYFAGGTFAPDATTSAAVDGGDPRSAYAGEIQPHGYRLNIGYDGATAAASLADLSETRPEPATDTLQIYSYPATHITDKGATVKADISSLPQGIDTATVTLKWGTAKDNLTNTKDLGTYGKWQTAIHTIDNMAGVSEVCYQFTATANGATYETDPRTFKIAVLPQIDYRGTDPVYSILRATAKFAYSYRDSGGDTTAAVTLTADGGETKTIIINDNLPIAVGEHSLVLTDLTPGTTYTLTLSATSGAGTTTLEPITFTTRAADTPLNIYVAEKSSGKADGSSPADAISDLNTVMEQFTTHGDEIRLLEGVYNFGEAIKLKNLTDITITGGYNAQGEIVGITTISNDWSGAGSHRLIDAEKSTVTLRNLLLYGGYDKVYNGRKYGAGLLFTDCNTTITNCTFTKNVNRSDNDNDYTGIGLGILRGTVEIYNSTFTNHVTAGSYNFKCIGNALGIEAATKVLIKECVFADNRLSAKHDREVHGAAMGLSNCPDAKVIDSLFTNNTIAVSQGHGGHIYLTGTRLHVENTTFTGGYTICDITGASTGNGGAIYANSASHLTITGSRFLECGYTPDKGNSTDWSKSYNGGCGSIDAAGSTTIVAITNVLIRGLQRGHLFRNNGATYDIVNCTIAGGSSLTTTANAKNVIYKQNNGTAHFKNNIIYGNAQSLYIPGDIVGSTPTFEYCCLEEEHDGEGNIVADPLFADTTYYHVASRAGSTKGGYLSGGTITADAETSPTIDAGSYHDSVGAETQPHFGRINMGYDGGTAAASRTDLDDTDAYYNAEKLQVLAYPATDISGEGAKIKGFLASTGGGESATITLEWGNSDDPTSWTESATVGTYEEQTEFSYTLTGITDYSLVYYRLKAENGTTTDYTSPVRNFKLAQLAEIAYDTYPVTHVTRNSAKVHLVLQPNESEVTIWVEVSDNGGNKVATFNANNGFAVNPGSVTIDITGLTPGATYTYKVIAHNAVGNAVLEGDAPITTIDADASVTLYVSPANIGSGDGSAPGHASGDINYITSILTTDGSELRFLEGVHNYPNDVITVTGNDTLPRLTISGRWKADGTQTGGETIISNDWTAAATHRIMAIEKRTVTIKDLTIKGGNYKTGNPMYGHGINLNTCDTLITNCTFLNNGLYGADRNDVVSHGAVGVRSGTIEVVDSVFKDNISGDGQNFTALGNALGAENATKVIIKKSHFENNGSAFAHARNYGGGALGFKSSPDILIDNCHFTNNFTRSGGRGGNTHYGDHQTNYGPLGGTLYFNDCAKATVNNCEIYGSWNCARNSTDPLRGWGGTIYACGATSLAIVNTSVLKGGDLQFTSGGVYTDSTGSIDANGNKCHIAITNMLFAGSKRGHAFGTYGGAKMDIVNTTITGSEYIKSGSAYIHKSIYIQGGSAGGGATFRNCIIWENGDTVGNIGTLYEGAAPTIINSINQFGEDLENIDPLFKDPANGDYTLTNHSPAKDKGDKTGFNSSDRDLNGKKRVVGGKIDLGPYEIQSNPLIIILR